MAEKKVAYDFTLGRIHTDIRENEDRDGGVWYDIKITRLYKAGSGESKDAWTFSRDDVPVVKESLSRAYSWIWDQQMVCSKAEED